MDYITDGKGNFWRWVPGNGIGATTYGHYERVGAPTHLAVV